MIKDVGRSAPLRVVTPTRSRLLQALVSLTSLLGTGVVLTLIPIWYRAFDSWSVNLVLSPFCVVAAIALTAAVMFRAPRWARVAISGLVGGTVHLATVATIYDVSSFGWAVVWAVGTGSIVVAVVGGMFAGVYQAPNRQRHSWGRVVGLPATYGDRAQRPCAARSHIGRIDRADRGKSGWFAWDARLGGVRWSMGGTDAVFPGRLCGIQLRTGYRH